MDVLFREDLHLRPFELWPHLERVSGKASCGTGTLERTYHLYSHRAHLVRYIDGYVYVFPENICGQKPAHESVTSPICINDLTLVHRMHGVYLIRAVRS